MPALTTCSILTRILVWQKVLKTGLTIQKPMVHGMLCRWASTEEGYLQELLLVSKKNDYYDSKPVSPKAGRVFCVGEILLSLQYANL